MKAPEHIKVARKQGAKAGLEHLHTYLARNTNDGTNGLPTNIAMLEDIRKAGGFRKRGRNAGTFKNEDKAVAWYCNHFAKKFGTDKLSATQGLRNTRAAANASAGGDSAIAHAGSRRQVRRPNQQVEQVEPDTSTTPTPDVDPTDLAALIAAAVAAAMNAVGNEDIEDEDDEDDDTNGEAETATAPTTTYPGPRDPDADATNGKLWTLNTEGPEYGYFLVVVDEDFNLVAGGEGPLKNGECHELIAEIRADS